jgi:hypothetical protein
MEVQLHSFLATALAGSEQPASRPSTSPQREEPWYPSDTMLGSSQNCTGHWYPPDTSLGSSQNCTGHWYPPVTRLGRSQNGTGPWCPSDTRLGMLQNCTGPRYSPHTRLDRPHNSTGPRYASYTWLSRPQDCTVPRYRRIRGYLNAYYRIRVASYTLRPEVRTGYLLITNVFTIVLNYRPYSYFL